MGATRQRFAGIVCSPLERRRVLFEVDFACRRDERGPSEGEYDVE